MNTLPMAVGQQLEVSSAEEVRSLKARLPILVKVTGLTHKMKNKVRSHGPTWRLIDMDQLGLIVLLETIDPVHHQKHPYSVWVALSYDAEIQEIA
jgi:hypothetical protein